MILNETSARRCRFRKGASIAEVVVSSVLLISSLGIVGTGAVGTQRMLRDGQNYRLAVDELSNQLELLTVLPERDLEEAIAALSLPEYVTSRLAGATIHSEVIAKDSGKWIRLSIDWDRPGDPDPIVMVALLHYSMADVIGESTTKERLS